MSLQRAVDRVVAVVLVVPIAVAVGSGVAILSAIVGHALLEIAIGEEAIPAFDNTIWMRLLVFGNYVAGIVAGIGVLICSWLVVVRPRT